MFPGGQIKSPVPMRERGLLRDPLKEVAEYMTFINP